MTRPPSPAHGSPLWDAQLDTIFDYFEADKAPGVVATGAGIDPTGATDSTTAFQALINLALAQDHKVLWVPGGLYRFNSGLTTGTGTQSGLRIIGAGAGRDGSGGGTELRFYGSGAFMSNGTDNGHAYDAADYDGPQSVELNGLYIRVEDSLCVTALDNGLNNYKSGTYGFRDWRGGWIKIRDCWFQGFQDAFWGIQSDINDFNNVVISYCHRGLYIGPRSDQNTLSMIYSNFCDTVIQVDGAHGTRIRDGQFVGDGAAATYPIMVGGGAWVRGSKNTVIDRPWFEHYTGAGSATIDAFVGVGTLAGDTVAAKSVTIRNPSVWCSPSGVVAAIATVGNGTYVSLDDPSGDTSNYTDLFRFIGTTSPAVRIRCHIDLDNGWLNSGSGSPSVTYEMYGNSQQYLRTNSPRFHFENSGTANVLRDYYMASEIDRQWTIKLPSDPNNAVKLQFSRRRDDGTAAPTTGTWAVGDYRANTVPAVGQPTGWYCTVAGTPGTWVAAANL